MLDYDVLFFSNTPDDTHCLQAALKMVLKYFEPNKDYSWEELERITAKVEGMWTWQYAMMIWLTENGFDVTQISLFDDTRFSKEGYDYMVEFSGKERADANRTRSDLAQEQRLAKKITGYASKQMREAELDDIKRFLEKGYLVICSVNFRVLSEKDGYVGHSLVVKGFDDRGFIVHDSGLPPVKNRNIDYDKFEKAWGYPTRSQRNLIAIKKNP